MLKGSYGENLARSYLRRKNYRIVAKNYRCGLGEIDIVARKGDLLVFAEVKSRRDNGLVEPFESVTREKQSRLSRLAEHFVVCHGFTDMMLRFDVISILFDAGGKVRKFVHIEDAF
jgi:putative endonuclease